MSGSPRRADGDAVVCRACRLLIAASLLAAAAAAAGEQGVTVRFGAGGERVEVVGLPPQTLAAVRAANLDQNEWKQVLSVSVAGEEATAPAPMLGKYAVDDGALAFTPRFPLLPGLAYRAVFNPAAIPGNPVPNAAKIETSFALPKPPAPPATTVAAVYPSGDALPANLLKFYIHFSAPMSRGDSYRRIRLLEADGSDAPDAFLELGEELWNSTGTRLTLLFDPGRIKRGLKPNEDVGAPLVAGRGYALVIDASWPDAQGRPLARGFIKKFRVTTPDDVQPDPRRWQVTPPPAGTRQPLAVEFDEPLDRALVEHMLAMHDPAGRKLAGRVAVDDRETQWRFEPEGPWQAGAYELVVDAAIEDRAGNSVGRLFETQGPTDPKSDDPVVLRYEIPPQK